jgi:hypothetical protein
MAACAFANLRFGLLLEDCRRAVLFFDATVPRPLAQCHCDLARQRTSLPDRDSACKVQWSCYVPTACRDVQLWTCDDCLRAYKAWLCASLFPRCVGAAVDDGVTKPCLELCWTVSRR